MAGVITEEMFTEMLSALDADGDGTVTKDEFKDAWYKLHSSSGKPAPTAAEFDKTWAGIDADGDGTLSCEELAKHFGFDLKAKGGSQDMSEEQILEALSMQSFLFDDVFKKLTKESNGRRKSVELEKMPKPVGAKQTRLYLGVTTIRVPQQIKESEEDERLQFMMACEMGDKEDIHKDWIEAGKLVPATIYIEDDTKGETPLMKMTRHGMINEIREMLLLLSKTKLPDAQKYYINLQDKAGKNALFFAVEYRQPKLVQFFIERGADLSAVANNGRTVLHHAVQSAKDKSDVETIEILLGHERATAEIRKELLSAQDGEGRTVCHITAIKAIEEITTLLLEKGANPLATDNTGNNSVALAERAGRRKSKELLDEFIAGKNGGAPATAAAK